MMGLELPVFRKTFPAVNRPSFSWFERNLGLNATVGTDCLMKFSGTCITASETSAVVVSATPVAVSPPEGIPSVIKTHSCFTSAYSG